MNINYPNSWSYLKLDEVANIIDGDRSSNYPSKSDVVDAGILFINTSNIKNHRFVLDNVNYITQDRFERITKGKLEKNDIVITLRGSIGHVALFNDSRFDTGFINAQMAILRTKDLCDPRFFHQELSSDNFQQVLSNAATGSAQPQLPLKDLRHLRIPVPPLPEQNKIAKILSTVDNHIDEVDGMIEDLKELKKGLMQKLLTEGIGHTEFKDSEVGRIPVEWAAKRLYDCIEKVLDYRGRTPKKLGLDWGNGNIPALSANNVKMGRVDFSLPTYYGSYELYEMWMKDAPLQYGDVLMTMEAPLGNVAQVPSTGKHILSQRVVAFKTKKLIQNDFLRYALMSPYFQFELDKHSTGTTAKGINQKNLSKLYIAVPTLREQKEIADILSSVDRRLEAIKDQKDDFIDLKKGLMQQLLTGKTRVKIDN